ncbi:DNA cytosine methyltransferase [Streptomyces sp. NPDC051211]|uniref:DNA cytosine methyltransferase n=1 Tax=Streptomyces sp. NPDC051211 TaxID=3154643 RepID=UPI003450ACBB
MTHALPDADNPDDLLGGVSAPVRPLRTIDLFAGCGGLTQGFADVRHGGRAVYKPIAAVELDEAAAATYAVNFGGHVYQGDIAKWVARVDGIPEADIVLGGPPCQGFSRLGNQDPDDKRNQLWRHYLTVVSAARPKAFVMENVDAFRRSPEFKLLVDQTHPGGALSDYVIRDEIINAADHGVPQRRLRTILVGLRKDLLVPGTVQRVEDVSELELQPLLIPGPRQTPQQTVWETISDLVLRKPSRELPDRWEEINGRRVAGRFTMDELHLRRNGITDRSMERYRAIPEGGNRFNLPDELLSPCWRKHKTGSADVMGRLFRDKPSVTIRTEFFKPEKGRYLHPWLHRPITHLEAALLQGFPPGFVWCGSRNQIARQIGNAVPVGLGRAIAEHLAPLLLAQVEPLAAQPIRAPRARGGKRNLAVV